MNKILSSILGGWLDQVKPALSAMAKPITAASVATYLRITADLLPTPVKCHYTFNLRDPAKMIQGMMMIDTKKSLKDEEALLKLWVQEGKSWPYVPLQGKFHRGVVLKGVRNIPDTLENNGMKSPL